MSRLKHSVIGVTLLSLLVTTNGCTFVDSFVPKAGESTDVLDRQQNLTVDDFRNINNAKKLLEDKNSKPVVPTAELGVPPIPDLAQVLAAPRPPKVANTKLVTLSVTEDVPLRDVLFELGRLAKVDIEVGPGLDKEGVNLRATDQPFNEVIEKIADLGNLRYTVGKNSIRVEKDTPYIKSYTLSFLNLERSSTSSYNLSTTALGSGSSGGGSSSGGGGSSGSVGTSGSSSTITGKTESDLWKALDSSIKEILSYSPQGDAKSDTSSSAASSGTTAAAGGSSNFVLNKEAGILTVNATDRQHEMIKRFLAEMTRSSSAQVLIEAKIVEVSLIDQYQAGVNWNKVLGDTSHSFIDIGKYVSKTPADSIRASGTTGITAALNTANRDADLNAILALTQSYGTTRTLSSPRLSAINNQQAILTFARNEVVQKCTTTAGTVTPGANGVNVTQPSVKNCEASSLPIGIVLNILPTIDLDTQEVTLSVRPTLTRIVDTVPDASTNPDGTPSDNRFPVIEVRELDSIAKVRSGGVMIIGGLMEDATRNVSDGAPGISELPIFGNLFKSRAEDSLKRELVIFIKAKIVNSDGNTDKIDRAVYKKYTTDPRPLFPQDQQ